MDLTFSRKLNPGQLHDSLDQAFIRTVVIGLQDIAAGLVRWRLWTQLGWNDIRLRYRRSTLGPFWITISMAIFVVLLGVIYARIFKMDVATYLPYVAAGLIAWSFISATLTEATASFVEGTGIIKQVPLPFSIYVLRTIWRAFIIFLHTVVVMIPILLFLGGKWDAAMLLVFPGLLLVVLNQVWAAMIIAVLSTRFRDVVPLIATALQIMMFATPIMWPASLLGDSSLVADVNPLYHALELVRAPMLGLAPSALSWMVMIVMNLIGLMLAGYFLGRGSRRIVYWL